MADLEYTYLSYPAQPVKDKSDFYKSGLNEAGTIRNLCTTGQRLFMVNSLGTTINVISSPSVTYRIDFKAGNSVIAKLYYCPAQRRLDIYEGNSRTPLAVWKSKRCIYKGYSDLFIRLKVENLFLPLVSFL